MKRILSLFLALTLLATMGIVSAASADDLTTIKVMIWDRGDAPAGGSAEDNAMTRWINEQVASLGIQVQFVSTARSGSDGVLQTWMAGGQAPDVVFTYDQNIFVNFATQGGLKDMSAAIEALGENSNIKTYLSDVMNMGYVAGGQYALLSKRGVANPRHTAYIRADWLEELGLSMPTTKDELISVLYAFKEAKPDCIPWAMSGRTDTEKNYLNFIGSYVTFADEKDEYVYSEAYITMHDGAIDGIREMNKLYNDGIIMQDFATDTTEDMYKAAVSSGKVGFVLDDNTRIFDYMETLNSENGTQVRSTFVPVSCFTQADGSIRNPFEYSYGMYVMIPWSTDDAKISAVVTYLNWLSDPEVAENIAYSPEHTRDETGTPVPFTGDELSAKGYKTTLDDYNILNKHFAFTETREGAIASYQGTNTWETYDWFANLYDTLQIGKFIYPVMSTTPDAEAEKGQIITDDMLTYVYRLISCPTDQFDALEAQLRADMNNAGLQEILDARAAMWDANH